jgi:hypothetical protein
MRTCKSGKECYASGSMALEALLEVHRKRQYFASKGPVNFYKCEFCHFWHLTSTGMPHKEVQAYLNSGKTAIQDEANKWGNKWKGR